MITPLLQTVEAELRLMGTETLISKCAKRFPKCLCVFKMTDNHFSEVHHTLLNVMVFMVLFSLQSFCKPFVHFF